MRREFEIDELVVHPNHGVGHVSGLSEKEVAGQLGLYLVVTFPRAALTLCIPEQSIDRSGLRRPCSKSEIELALSGLSGPPATLKGPWSRWAAEYGAKLNSGNPEAMVEVARDLHGTEAGGSKARLHDEALVRLAEEFAVIEQIEFPQAHGMLNERLSSQPQQQPTGTLENRLGG